MPIHVRANPGDYAEACLLPGDPLRAEYIANTFLEDVVQRNSERGMLGYTGTFQGKPVSVQSSGMGCPSAAIVIEELVQLGVKKLMRVGTCGGLQPDLSMGDLIVALSATPADSTATHYVGGEPHAPTADFGLVHEAVHQARHLGKDVRVGPIVSSDIFYQPGRGPGRPLVRPRDPGRRDGGRDPLHPRSAPQDPVRLHADRLRRRRRGRVRPDHRRRDAKRRRPDDGARARHRDGLTLAGDAVFLVNPASANGATGRRWPELARRAAATGLEGDALLSERQGHLAELAREAALGGARLLVVVGGDGSVNEVANGLVGLDAAPEVAVVPRGTDGTSCGRTGSRGRSSRRSRSL